MTSVLTSPETATKPTTARAAKVKRSGRVVAVNDIIDKKPTRISDLLKKRVAPGTTDLKVTFGADPECTLIDTQTGSIVSAIPILKRDKHHPIDVGGGVSLFADSTLCEFNMRPASSKAEFIANLRDALSRVQGYLGDRYRLFPQAAHDFTDAEMQPYVDPAIPPEQRQSYTIVPTLIGCTPSVDMLRAELNQPEPFKDNMRTGSFHLHIGNADYAKENDGRLLTFNSRHDTVKLIALYMGLGTVIFSRDATSKRRRAIYGRGHEGRVTPYGLEARLGEPYPLRSPEMVELVYDLTEHALSHIKNRTEQDVLAQTDSFAVEKAINECDKDTAMAILKQTDLPADLMARIQKDYQMPDLKTAWGL